MLIERPSTCITASVSRGFEHRPRNGRKRSPRRHRLRPRPAPHRATADEDNGGGEAAPHRAACRAVAPSRRATARRRAATPEHAELPTGPRRTIPHEPDGDKMATGEKETVRWRATPTSGVHMQGLSFLFLTLRCSNSNNCYPSLQQRSKELGEVLVEKEELWCFLPSICPLPWFYIEVATTSALWKSY